MPGLSIDLITSALGQKAESEQFARDIRILKVPAHNRSLHHSSNRELTRFAIGALPLALREHRKYPYDFCFAWSALPAGAVAWALRALTGLRYLVRVCGPDIPGFEKRYQPLYTILTPLIRATWRSAHVVVAKCEGEADMIRAVDSRVPVELIANGVDLGAFEQAASIPDAGPLRILCVARLIERKGQRHLIQAVRNLRDQGVDASLELVGTGDAQTDCEALVRQLDMAEHVRFAGYVPREQIAQRYAAAHVFVLPSFNEGMSVATLEAMAAGLPVVVTRTPGMAELVIEEQNGLTFDWADVNALTGHLRRLANDRALARQMGAASRERARKFTWEGASTQYLQVFQWALAVGNRLDFNQRRTT